MKKFLLVLAANVMLLPLAFGQRTFSKPPADTTRITKETVVIITEENAGNYFEKRKQLNLTTLIKVNPLVLVNGDLPIYVEQKLTDKMSAEVSAGITYKNYIYEFFDESFTDGTDVTRTNKTGYSFSGALHFYPSKSSTILEGLYFGPEIRYRNYKHHATEISNMEVDFIQSKILTDVKLSIGSIRYVEDNVFIETYFGIGVRAKSWKNRLKSEMKYDPEIGYDRYQVNNYNENSFGPVVSAGFKLGYAF